MGDVLRYTGVSRLDTPAENVISDVTEHGMESVVVAGYDKEGVFQFWSSQADGADVLWLLALAQKKLLDIG